MIYMLHRILGKFQQTIFAHGKNKENISSHRNSVTKQ